MGGAMIPGRYFMHENAMDVCFYVLEVRPNGQSLGMWYNLGYTGNPWPIDEAGIFEAWINGNWRDVTEKINQPRPWNE